MTGSVQALLAASGASPGPVASFNRWQVIAQAPAGTNSTATLSFRADGTVTGTGSPTDQTIAGSSAWYFPTGGTPGSNFWIKATNTGTALTGGDATGSWLALSQNRSWSMTKPTTSAIATLKIEIATDSSGVNVVFTSLNNTVMSDHLV